MVKNSFYIVHDISVVPTLQIYKYVATFFGLLQERVKRLLMMRCSQ